MTLLPNGDISVDAADFDRLAAAALSPAVGQAAKSDQLRAGEKAVERYPGPLLPGDPYESWALRERERLALRHRELLRILHRYDEILALDPTDEAAHVALMRRRLRSGDWRGALAQFAVLAGTLRTELGVGPSREAVALRREAMARRPAPGPVDESPDPMPPPRHADLATQSVGYCTTADGVRLAYATSGQGPTLVKVANWLTHLDYDWASPVWRPWWQALSVGHRLVRYDERGCGLSTGTSTPRPSGSKRGSPTSRRWSTPSGCERFPLLGMSQGGPIAISYAARHPERVSAVIIYGTCARATWARATPERRRELARARRADPGVLGT